MPDDTDDLTPDEQVLVNEGGPNPATDGVAVGPVITLPPDGPAEPTPVVIVEPEEPAEDPYFVDPAVIEQEKAQSKIEAIAKAEYALEEARKGLLRAQAASVETAKIAVRDAEVALEQAQVYEFYKSPSEEQAKLAQAEDQKEVADKARAEAEAAAQEAADQAEADAEDADEADAAAAEGAAEPDYTEDDTWSDEDDDPIDMTPVGWSEADVTTEAEADAKRADEDAANEPG